MLAITLQELARAMGGEVAGGQVICPGPGHSAKDRSLSIKLDRCAPDGFIVYSHCGDDPLECRDYVRVLCGEPPFRPRHKTAVYEYRDPASGNIAYLKKRIDLPDGGKTFAFVPSGRSGSPPLLYGGELLADLGAGATVWIVEGENKADRLRELGAAAVSLDSGANSKWLPEHAALLRGLRIILWPDSDSQGEGYAARAHAAIKACDPGAGVYAVRPFGPPNGVSKGLDACDWDGDAGALAGLESNAEPYAPCERPARSSGLAAPDQPPATAAITAKPYIWRDPKTIPPRRWLHADHYVRGSLSVTVAPGGLGKTSLQLVEAAGMTSGRDLLRGTKFDPLKVWYWNLEDPCDEIDRRIAAILLYYEIDGKRLEGRLFVNGGEPLIVATKKSDAISISEPAVSGIISEMLRLGIDVIIIDPFVSSHRVPENDNSGIDAVAKTWSGIAQACNASVELAHHIRKPFGGNTAATTVDDARGAGALRDTARSMRVLNTMTKEEAEDAGIKPSQRGQFFHVGSGKANMQPPAENAEWRKLVSVHLGNDTPEQEGDWVGAVTAWKCPGPLDGLSTAELLGVQKEISAGKWRGNPQAKFWAGNAVAKALNLDVREPAVKKRIFAMLKIWIRTGALKVVEDTDERRRKVNFVEVGAWAV